MERLYTPWRLQFVTTADTATGCFLCDAPARDADDQTFIVYRGERVFAILNLYPYNSGHVLVAPYAHGGDLVALDAATAAELMAAGQRITEALRAEYAPDGFNLGMNLGRSAGAGVPDHLHLHVLPRWTGDTSFLPVVSDTKTLPETLPHTWARLHARLRAR